MNCSLFAEQGIMKFVTVIFVLLCFLAVACSKVIPVPLPVKVLGVAMEPALYDGDRIFINRNPAEFSRGDIVLFHHPHDQRGSAIKRIIGLPGETIEIREGKVLINGRALEEPYVDPLNNQVLSGVKEIKIPKGSYYVLGDNRDNSADSRIWGPLSQDLIFGKFVTKYYSAK